MDEKLNQARLVALESVDRAESKVKQAIVGAAAIEAIMLGAFFYTMDFGSRLDWLLLISAVLVYATLSVGLLALGFRIELGTLRVPKALELHEGHED